MGGGGQGVGTPPEKSQNIGFLNNIYSDTLKNHKATKPEFISWAIICTPVNAISMAFLWADDCLLIVVFSPHQLKKTGKKTRRQNFLDSRR